MAALTHDEWKAKGLPSFAAEALEDLETDEAEFEAMSFESALRHILEWNGIIGYTEDILATMRALKETGKAPPL